MQTGAQSVFALAFCQEPLTGFTRPRIFQTVRTHTDDDECRTTELLCVDGLNRIRLRMDHAEGATALDAILTDRDDLAAFADERDVRMIAPVFAGVTLLIRQNGLLHVALNPAGQGLCGRQDGHCVCADHSMLATGTVTFFGA